ncbi:MAG: AraC family transcriptional regulator [Pseudomonadota bacterium]
MPLDRLNSLLRGICAAYVSPYSRKDATFTIHLTDQGHATVGIGPVGDGAAGAFVFACLECGLDWGAVLAEGQGLRVDVASDDPAFPLILLLRDEMSQPRCGAAHLMAGYVEAILVHVLRQVIERKNTAGGVLAGLSHPRLKAALVAVHDHPGRLWRVGDLARIAGMSRSGFMAEFRAVVGDTPMAYLRRWRMNRACEDLVTGRRVSTVARRYGYGSAESFSRAFSDVMGRPPRALVGQTDIRS